MGSADKRREKRFKRRMRVVFEADGKSAGAYTINMSARGMQVTAAVVFPTGTLLKGRAELGDGREVPFDAKVRWAVKGVGTYAMVKERTMGVELLPPVPRELLQLLEGAREETGRVRDSVQSRPLTPPPMAPVTPRGPAPRPAIPPPGGVPRPVAPAGVPMPRPAATTPAPGGTGPVVGRQATAVRQMTDATPLTTTWAAALVEEASVKALDPTLPADQTSRGVNLTITIMDTEPLSVGASIQAAARVQQLGGNGRLVELSIQITELGRPVATASHTRVIVRRRSG